MPQAPQHTNGDLTNLVANAKVEQHYSSIANGSNSNNNKPHTSDTSKVRLRNSHLVKMPFSNNGIQNRDSINWDTDSDSDEAPSEPELINNGHRTNFVDVTDAPFSAFHIVQPHKNGNVNNQYFMHSHTRHMNGKVYQPPQSGLTRHQNPSNTAANGHDLHQQCRKLQELQRDYDNRSSTANSPTSPTSQNSMLGSTRSINSPVISPKGSNGCTTKPVVAPKPKLSSKKFSSNTANVINVTVQKHVNEDYKSTTV